MGDLKGVILVVGGVGVSGREPPLAPPKEGDNGADGIGADVFLLKIVFMSPLKLSILIWYHCSVGDFEKPSPAADEAIREFVALGLLKETEGERTQQYEANREALAIYFEAVMNVPLPVMKWVIVPEKRTVPPNFSERNADPFWQKQKNASWDNGFIT